MNSETYIHNYPKFETFIRIHIFCKFCCCNFGRWNCAIIRKLTMCVCWLCAGAAVHSIMHSWEEAGTNSSWLTDTRDQMGIAWSFTKHPCDQYWLGVFCDSKLIQGNSSTVISTYYFLTQILLWVRKNSGLELSCMDSCFPLSYCDLYILLS